MNTMGGMYTKKIVYYEELKEHEERILVIYRGVCVESEENYSIQCYVELVFVWRLGANVFEGVWN